MSEKLNLRELRGDDLFPVLSLIDKLELIDPITELVSGDMRKDLISVSDGDEDTDVEAVGLTIVLKIAKIAVRNVPKAKTEINDLLGDLTGTDSETVAELPMKDYIGLVKDFFMHEDFRELLESVIPSEA